MSVYKSIAYICTKPSIYCDIFIKLLKKKNSLLSSQGCLLILYMDKKYSKLIFELIFPELIKQFPYNPSFYNVNEFFIHLTDLDI